MRIQRCAALILCTALAAPLAASPAGADPSTPLTGFGDFGAGASQVGFDDLGLALGDPVAAAGGVGFALGSVPAPYYEDESPRESGLEGIGALANFFLVERPFPALEMTFPTPVHRVAFEARVNPADELDVTLLAGGVEVDHVVLPSRGSDALYFYGLQNAAAFDEVHVTAVVNASGAFTSTT